MYSGVAIIMAKKIIPEKTPDYLKDLIYEIPLDQRKRIVKNKAYREGWLDSTLFWKIQFDNTSERWQTKYEKEISPKAKIAG